MHAWLARYEREGMEGMGDRSHRPTHCPHQMPALNAPFAFHTMRGCAGRAGRLYFIRERLQWNPTWFERRQGSPDRRSAAATTMPKPYDGTSTSYSPAPAR